MLFKFLYNFATLYIIFLNDPVNKIYSQCWCIIFIKNISLGIQNVFDCFFEEYKTMTIVIEVFLWSEAFKKSFKVINYEVHQLDSI